MDSVKHNWPCRNGYSAELKVCKGTENRGIKETLKGEWHAPSKGNSSDGDDCS